MGPALDRHRIHTSPWHYDYGAGDGLTRERLFPHLAEWPRCSKDRIFLWEAMQLVGAARFGADWTGDEIATVVYWPASPMAEVEGAIRKAQYSVAPLVGGGYRSLERQPFDQHVLDRQASIARRSARPYQTRWELNAAKLDRLKATAEILQEWFRESRVRTFARAVSFGHDPQEMRPDEWFLENLFNARFRPGQYKRMFPGTSPQILPVYVFVDRPSLEAAISLLPHADAIVTTTDLATLSPYLRFAVAFALQNPEDVRRGSSLTRDALSALIKERWDKANPGDPMPPTMAMRMSHVVTHHNPEAIATGTTGHVKKTGATP